MTTFDSVTYSSSNADNILTPWGIPISEYKKPYTEAPPGATLTVYNIETPDKEGKLPSEKKAERQSNIVILLIFIILVIIAMITYKKNRTYPPSKFF